MTLLGILVACIMFALLIRAFAQSYGQHRGDVRFADWPDDPRLIGVEEVAAILDTSPDEVMTLAIRDAIPHLVVRDADTSMPEAYRFDREEIDDWVID